jgi:hypothetical protein
MLQSGFINILKPTGMSSSDVVCKVKKALKIKDKSLTYINEEKAWNETIYDILSLSCFFNKKYKESLRYIKKALKLNDQDERLKQNYLYIKKYAI